MAKTEKFMEPGEGFTTVTLTRPATIAGAQVSFIRLREPLVRDRRAAGKGGGSDEDIELRLMGNLCDMAPEDIESLPLKDYGRLQSALMDFIS